MACGFKSKHSTDLPYLNQDHLDYIVASDCQGMFIFFLSQSFSLLFNYLLIYNSRSMLKYIENKFFIDCDTVQHGVWSICTMMQNAWYKVFKRAFQKFMRPQLVVVTSHLSISSQIYLRIFLQHATWKNANSRSIKELLNCQDGYHQYNYKLNLSWGLGGFMMALDTLFEVQVSYECTWIQAELVVSCTPAHFVQRNEIYKLLSSVTLDSDFSPPKENTTKL